MNKNEILKKLTSLNQIIANDPVDSKSYQDASQEISEMLFDHVNIRDVDFIVKSLGRELTNEEVADLIIAGQNNQPLNKAISLPTEADAAYTIRWQRQQHHITQKQLAKEIGVTQGQLAKIENGQQNASLNLLQRVMNAFNESYTIKPTTSIY